VRDAYYHPKVDNSEEPFKWGMPDLDGLRMFFHQELGWQQSKVDELLLPIIQRMNKRNQTAALNKQGVLNEFLDISAGSGTHAPRQRYRYASKRLQQVVSDFRKQQKSGSVTPASRSPPRAPSRDEGTGNDREPFSVELPAAKRRKKTKGKRPARGKGVGTRGNRRSIGKSSKDSSAQDITTSDGEDEFVPPQDGLEEVVKERDLRPRVKPRPAYRTAKEKQGSALVSDGC